MFKEDPKIAGKGLRFVWYAPGAGPDGSGGLGVLLKQHKKTRSFFAVLPVEESRALYDFLGKCLKKGG